MLLPVLRRHASNASTASVASSAAPTVIDVESEPPSPAENQAAVAATGSGPRPRSRSQSGRRDAALAPGPVRIRSSGRLCILPVSEPAAPAVSEPAARSRMPPPSTVRIRSAGSVQSSAAGEQRPSQMPVEAPSGFVDLEGNPIEGEWLMNGSTMPQPLQPDLPPPATRPRATTIPVAEPLAVPSFLGLRDVAAGSGMSSPMILAAAFREALARERAPTWATVVADGSDRGLEEAYRCAVARIGQHMRSGAAFYIGITENPGRRESEQFALGWDFLEVLVEAPSSRETGMLETRLIERFSRAPLCQNLGAGNERPSGGRPHYVYAVVRMSGLLRRGR